MLRLAAACGAFLIAASAAADSGLFVAVGYGGRRITSHDGVTWENDQRWSDVAADDDNVLLNIAFGAGKFVAVGGGAKIGHILLTPDGREWRELPQLKGRVATIVFGNDRFIAAHDAELLHSRDDVVSDFEGCAIEHAFEGVRAVNEGRLHRGDGHVVQVIARRRN